MFGGRFLVRFVLLSFYIHVQSEQRMKMVKENKSNGFIQYLQRLVRVCHL